MSECPDLVVVDLNMPVMDGLAATERNRGLKDRCGNVPVVAVTAFDTYGMREAATEVGCNAYLLKPLDLDELESVIAGLLTILLRARLVSTFRQRLHSGSPSVRSSTVIPWPIADRGDSLEPVMNFEPTLQLDA